jgi:hypothetical protein
MLSLEDIRHFGKVQPGGASKRSWTTLSPFDPKRILLFVAILSISIESKAWIYPEHRDITLTAVQRLDPARRAQLDQIWALARVGYESRLTIAVADVTQSVKPRQLDFAAWPAISGDHSTSAQNMVHNVLHTNWILEVADVAAQLKIGIAASKNNSELEGKLRTSDLLLLRVDPEYVSRAGANNVHFMISRPEVNTPAASYFEDCCKEGAAPNLIGVYVWYHASALSKAARLATESLNPEQKSALCLAMLADEAFALHFLQDGFSAGHVAGIWGNASMRKGTHDYYDEHGLEVTTWNGERLILTGDAYMRPNDGEKAAHAIRLSIEQLLAVAAGTEKIPETKTIPGSCQPDTFNVARALKMPAHTAIQNPENLFLPILAVTPVPGLSNGLGEIPRFRSELGPFIGIAPAGGISFTPGGFGKTQNEPGVIPGLEIALHMGLGMDGVLNKSGDGLVFVDLGWRLDGASTVKIKNDKDYKEFGSILSAIPSREALYARLRLPYYLIPGDLLVLGPIMMAFFPKALNKVITTAGQGGLIPWQTGIITPAGRFQFVLGREVGVYFYGATNGVDAFLIPNENDVDNQMSLISMKTTRLDFPFLEFRPIRTFSRKQSASLLVQFYGGVEIPGKVTMKTTPEANPLKPKTIWMMGIRLGFDWRYYFSEQKAKI